MEHVFIAALSILFGMWLSAKGLAAEASEEHKGDVLLSIGTIFVLCGICYFMLYAGKIFGL